MSPKAWDSIFTPACKAGPHDDKLSQVIFLDSNSAICFLPPQTRYIQIIHFILKNMYSCFYNLHYWLWQHCWFLLYKLQMSQFPSTQSFIDFFVLQSVWLYGCRGHGTIRKQNKTNVKYQNFGYEKHYKRIIKLSLKSCIWRKMNEWVRSFLVSSLCLNLSPPSSDVPILTGKYFILDAQENHKNKNQKKSIILWIRFAY